LRSESVVSGTFCGDPNNRWINVVASENNSVLTIEGQFSNFGTVLPLLGTFTMPSPNTNTNYISIQSDASGNLTMYTNISSPNVLVGVIEVYSEIVPPSAGSDEQFSSDSEPSVD
jgi:hypothetical protein